MKDQTHEIRIYVACLASYNNGHLHGRWIYANQSAAAIWALVSDMLKDSPIEEAEEWAIHGATRKSHLLS
ncbi:antirestriction protein ArdA, partial [Hyphomonas atlantica]|uniref:antirestriction protein ArdA n=1 Tax=Hyphomonas atlantica TaxID=1280948 RepID=UPI0005570561